MSENFFRTILAKATLLDLFVFKKNEDPQLANASENVEMHTKGP